MYWTAIRIAPARKKRERGNAGHIVKIQHHRAIALQVKAAPSCVQIKSPACIYFFCDSLTLMMNTGCLKITNQSST